MVDSVRAPRESGMALLMVILVLAALAAIGTPFAISMRLQEQGAARSVADQRARLGARSARDHAVSTLFDTHHSRERDQWEPGYAAPDLVDHLDEMTIEFPASISSTALGSAGPADYTIRGTGELILDAHVEDEQGKINLNTAMPNLIGNLLAGSHLSETISYDSELDELPLDDTSSFPVDDDPDTIDGVVVILNPVFFTVEAVSYTGKTETALTGIFRGQYLSGTWTHQEGWPVFDLRGLKVFLHRLANLSDGQIATFRTPLGIRQIADWSVVPYFLQTLAVVGLSFDNMTEWGLTPEMLVRAGIDPSVLKQKEEVVDEAEYRKARKLFLDNNIPREVVDLVESVRGKAAVIEASEVLERMDIDLGKAEGNAFKGVYQTFIAPELKKIRKQSKKYFPGAIQAYQEIFDLPGMETFSAFNYEEIREYITTSSTQPRAWSQEQMVEGEITNSALMGVPQMRLPRYDFYNPGTVIRIRSINDPSKVEYGLAAGAFPTPRGGFRGMGRGGIFQGGVIFKEPLRLEWGEREAMLSASLRHPVNINSAPSKVIEAVLTGLSTDRFGQRFNAVTVSEARKLTDQILEARPIAGFEKFREVVEGAQQVAELEGEDVTAILINALNPNHPRLSISTTGFCFNTSDIYTVESQGVSRNPAGYPEATVRLREIIEIAPPDPLFLRLETQSDWASLYSTRSTGGGRFSRFNSTFVPGRASNLMISGPIPLSRRQFTGPTLDEGTLRGNTITSEEVSGNYGFGNLRLLEIESFGETVEGHELEDGPWKRSVLLQPEAEQAGNPADRGGNEIVIGAGGIEINPEGLNPDGVNIPISDESTESLTTVPAMVDFWYRPRWGSRSGNRIIFDSVGATGEQYRDRIRFFFEGETQQLILQVFDDTGSALAWSNDVLPAAEVRHLVTPDTFADDTWYHISAGWRSTKPGDLVLLIDRRPVGRQSWLTRLSGGLSITGSSVSVVDSDMAARFPPSGTLLVGSEAIDYVGRQGSSFMVRPPGPNGQPPIGRGARGTVRLSHSAGTPVRLLGYSLPLANSDETLGVADAGNRIILGTGGASLGLEMAPTTQIGSVVTTTGSVQLEPATYARATTSAGNALGSAQGLVSTLELEPFGPASLSLLVQTVGSHPLELGFPPRGYLHIRQWSRNENGVMQIAATEISKYSSITPGPLPGLFRFTGMGRALLDSQATDGASTNPGDTRLVVRGISVETDSTNLGQAYAPSGVIQIDRPPGVLAGGVLQDVEWIRYTSIAEGKFFLCDPDSADSFRGYTGDRYVGSSDPFRRNRPRWDENGIVNHVAGQEIVQVVRTVGTGAGFMDEVILGDGFGNPLTRQKEALPLRVRKVRESDSGVYISFYSSPEGVYFPGQDPRIRKFPSGGLPSTSAGDLIFGTPAILGNGIDAPGTIDEVRFSRLDGVEVDTYAFPLTSGGSYRTDALPDSTSSSSARKEVLRTWFDENDSEQPGGGFDRLRLHARSKLIPVSGPNGFSRTFSRADPRSFGMGKREGLLLVDEEAMHYSFDPGAVEADVLVELTQDLPRDPFLDEDSIPDGTVLPYDPTRDLRAEVVDSIQVNNTQQLPPNGGFLEVITGPTREVLFYEQASNGVLRNVLRGQLGTPVGGYVYQWSYTDASGQPQVVTNTIRLRLLPSRDVDILTRSMLSTERASNSLGFNALLPVPSIPIVRLAGGVTEVSITTLGNPQGFSRSEGYLLVDDGNPVTSDEIIAHTGTSGEGFGLFRDDRSGRGIFRGRFGTTPGQHSSGTPAIELMARHHDRYQPLVESKDLQYFERAWTMPGTMWDRIGWQVEESRNRVTMGSVRVLARFDGVPGWDSAPTNKPGGLYAFDDPKDLNQIDRLSDGLELRVHYRHRRGAYGLVGTDVWNDEWKHLPVLNNLTIEHRKEWRILRREEIPY